MAATIPVLAANNPPEVNDAMDRDGGNSEEVLPRGRLPYKASPAPSPSSPILVDQHGRALRHQAPTKHAQSTNTEAKNAVPDPWFKRTGVTLAAVGTLISTISAVLALIFVVFPRLDPNRTGPAFGAALTVVGLEYPVELGEYLPRIAQMREAADAPNGRFNAGQMRWPGVIVAYTAAIEGYENQRCKITWTLFDSTTNQRAEDAALQNQPGWPFEFIIPSGQRDQVTSEVWVPYPIRDGTYFVRLDIADHHGIHLASATSDLFEVE